MIYIKGNITIAKHKTHNNTAINNKGFLYLSTINFRNLETKYDDIKLIPNKNNTSIKVYLPVKNVVKKEIKLVKHTVNVEVADVLSKIKKYIYLLLLI